MDSVGISGDAEFPRVPEDLNQGSDMKIVLWSAYLGFGVEFRLEVAKDS